MHNVIADMYRTFLKKPREGGLARTGVGPTRQTIKIGKLCRRVINLHLKKKPNQTPKPSFFFFKNIPVIFLWFQLVKLFRVVPVQVTL